MSQVMIEGFVHRPGGHCGSSAMRDVFKFHGYDLTEEMVFGLGSGIGFVYYDSPLYEPPVGIGGRIFDMEMVLCANLGIELEVVSGLDSPEAWSKVKELVADNKPTVVIVDVRHLDYLNAKRPFSQHRILVVGYDEDKGVSYVSDNDRDEIQELPLESLARARSSKGPPQPADNAFFIIKMPEKLPPVETVIPGAVKVAVERMTLPPEKASFEHDGIHVSFGLTGLNIFSSKTGEWPEIMDETTISRICKNIYVSAEKGGTGYGGNFRRLYGRFLVEASGLLKNGFLEKVGREFISIGDRWTDLSMTCKEKSGAGAEALREIEPIALEIYEREKEEFNKLKEFSSSAD